MRYEFSYHREGARVCFLTGLINTSRYSRVYISVDDYEMMMMLHQCHSD